jgi:hypothetical protein
MEGRSGRGNGTARTIGGRGRAREAGAQGYGERGTWDSTGYLSNTGFFRLGWCKNYLCGSVGVLLASLFY